MVRYIVIDMLLGLYIAEYLRQKPEAARETIERIVHEIETSSKGKLSYRQVIVIIGKLYKDGDKLENIPFKRRNTIAWKYQYLVSDEQSNITQAMDKGINRIVRKSVKDLLDKFYVWKVSPLKTRYSGD